MVYNEKMMLKRFLGGSHKQSNIRAEERAPQADTEENWNLCTGK